MGRMGVEAHEKEIRQGVAMRSLLSRQRIYWRNCDPQLHEAVVTKARLGSLTLTLRVMRQPNRLVGVTFGHFRPKSNSGKRMRRVISPYQFSYIFF